jgi:hypothetical protein
MTRPTETHTVEINGVKQLWKVSSQKCMSENMLMLQCTRETLAIAQYNQTQDCSNYEYIEDELVLSKLCSGTTNFQLFCISLFFSLFFIQLFFLSFFAFFYYILSCAPLSYTATWCIALRKPTEQSAKQWYASLVGKVPTQYIERL